GGHRPGNNLYGDSLVCVDLKTGQKKWHYQIVHHPICDLDMPAAPLIADIVVSGKPIKAVAQATKQGLLYVFDRVTGQPVRPITGGGEGEAADAPRPAQPAAPPPPPTPPPAAAGGGRGAAAPPAGGGFGATVQGLSIVKPPYGQIVAINLDKGDLMWSTPHG